MWDNKARGAWSNKCIEKSKARERFKVSQKDVKRNHGNNTQREETANRIVRRGVRL